jgi:hypothetical protein
MSPLRRSRSRRSCSASNEPIGSRIRDHDGVVVSASVLRPGAGTDRGPLIGGLVQRPKGAVCKTVGSAYVGSNPTPATTTENGPHAAGTRSGGPLPSCHAMYQDVSLWVDARQWLRTYSRQRPDRTSGAYNRLLCHLMAVGHGKDANRQAKVDSIRPQAWGHVPRCGVNGLDRVVVSGPVVTMP